MPRLGAELGCELYVKFEGLNPTGSFKDRGMTAAISEALGRGAQTVICASTGNTAASAAAYAARSGLRAIVLIPEGKVAMGKLAGAVAYGAQVIQVQGSFDDALSLVVEITQKTPIALVNSINPYRIEGQKSAAFEICDSLGSAPDWLCLPVGNAGNITSYWAGFKQYHQIKRPACRKFWESRRRGLPRWCSDTRSRSLRRWRPPSVLAGRRGANRPSKRRKSRTGSSSPFRTRKFSRPSESLPARGFGSNRLRRRAWPV
jgi:threonine synthase